MLQRLIAHGDDVPAPLIRYAQRQWERPAVQAWVALPRTA
jgi:glutathione S-transferase